MGTSAHFELRRIAVTTPAISEFSSKSQLVWPFHPDAKGAISAMSALMEAGPRAATLAY